MCGGGVLYVVKKNDGQAMQQALKAAERERGKQNGALKAQRLLKQASLPMLFYCFFGYSLVVG